MKQLPWDFFMVQELKKDHPCCEHLMEIQETAWHWMTEQWTHYQWKTNSIALSPVNEKIFVYICKHTKQMLKQKHDTWENGGKTMIKWRTSPRPPALAKRWHHPSAAQPPSQFYGVARQPKRDRDWGRRRAKREERKTREGRWGGGVTYQASVHSSGSACEGLEGHRWPFLQRAYCDHEEAEGGLHFGSSHQGPWACFEWAAAGAQHRHKKNTHQLTQNTSEPDPLERENSRRKADKRSLQQSIMSLTDDFN